MKLPDNIKKTLEILGGSGFEAWVVGGCVRDWVMGKTPDDYDVTTSALPEQTAKCFKDYTVVETGIKHGTITVVMSGENIEITTYRVDGEYLDNRRPEKVTFTRSLEEDLARRDFTMNAMAYNPEKGIVDLYGGQEDIKNRLIRCVGNPDKRFNEDGLRILRALRFAARTGFEIEEKTARSIRANKHLIKNLSAERVLVELKMLVMGKNAGKVIKDYTEVIGVILPEILPMAGFAQNTKYHCYDVLDHTLEMVKNSENSEVLKLTALFHDLGKPKAFCEDAEGIAHFKGHAAISTDMARGILNRLKSDNYTKNMVCALIEAHSDRIQVNKTAIKKLISEKGFEFTKLLLKVKKADASAKAPEYRNPAELDVAEKLIIEIEKSGDPIFLKDLEIGGDDLIKIGIAGKKVGEILNRLLDLVISEKIENKRKVLLEKSEEMRDEKD